MTDEAKLIVNILRACAVETQCSKCVVFCGNEECLFTAAAKIIESLAAELEQVEQERDGLNILLGQAQSMLETRTRERDAAVQDLNMSCPCEVCARSCQYDKVNPYDECADFMWRGVKEE